MTVRIIRTLEELEGVRQDWERWQAHVNCDLAQFELVCRLRPQIESPYVMVVERAGRASSVVAGRLEQARIPLAFGYLRLGRVQARVIAILHAGVVGELDEEAAAEVVAHLWSALIGGVAEAVDFHHLVEASPLLRALRRHGPRWFCEKTPRWSMHREMTLPESSTTELLKGKHRHHVRGRHKALDVAFPGQLQWRWLTRVDDVRSLCAQLEAVAAITYQRALGAGFFDNEEFRLRFELFASRGQLRVQLMEIDGKARAFWYGMVYRGVFHSSETGYDPALRQYEVGTLMFLRMIDELVREGVERLDFGLGDAQYKQRFGDRSWRETPVWLFAPSLKGAFLMLTVRSSQAIDAQARRLVQRFGLHDRLKSVWRLHKAKSTTEAAMQVRP
jgi:CelD/BcsL family acetyltransferase involved in cellulose biosynthesis